MRHTLPASLATIVIAIGLALTTIGVSRGLPHEFGGVGSRLTVAADAWAHGSAVSPPLVLLVAVGLLAAMATRTGRGGRRAGRWLALLGGAGLVAGWMEPVHQQILLFQGPDALLTLVVYASDIAIIAMVVAAIARARTVGSGTTAISAGRPALTAGFEAPAAA